MLKSEQMQPVRMAGMVFGLGPADMARAVNNPRELTARLRHQQTFPKS